MRRRRLCRSLCVCGVGLLAGCGGGGDSTPTLDRTSPESVVRVYLHRLSENDWKRAEALHHPEMADIDADDRQYYERIRYEVKTMEVPERGDTTATVRAKVRIDAEDRPPREQWLRFELRAKDGEWLVAAFIREPGG